MAHVAPLPIIRGIPWIRVAVLFALCGCAGADVNDEWRDGMRPKLDGPYCGDSNCYDLLGVSRASDSSEIRKAYRALAKEAHPDKNPSGDREQFQRIAAANEVLMSESSRRAYDWGLDNPMLLRMHLAQYRPVRSLPPMDLRFIIVGCLVAISGLQWFYRKDNYARGVLMAKLDPKSRRRFENLFAAELATAGVPVADAKRAIADAIDVATEAATMRTGKSVAKGSKKAGAKKGGEESGSTTAPLSVPSRDRPRGGVPQAGYEPTDLAGGQTAGHAAAVALLEHPLALAG
ncbi:hypothetical protein T492DRAFT_1150603 [Pavlovales sp. CCMP2436]|nr:hypothetical protein T492DRAFT_1150603 [Pavlovales sp. CCMP2436]